MNKGASLFDWSFPLSKTARVAFLGFQEFHKELNKGTLPPPYAVATSGSVSGSAPIQFCMFNIITVDLFSDFFLTLAQVVV